ncbi:hypothetical protein HBH71_241470 [Parastagonospora nodorum]|nr:hypothetical protein HBH71_241470 [Parastagonospora nodorum]
MAVSNETSLLSPPLYLHPQNASEVLPRGAGDKSLENPDIWHGASRGLKGHHHSRLRHHHVPSFPSPFHPSTTISVSAFINFTPPPRLSKLPLPKPIRMRTPLLVFDAVDIELLNEGLEVDVPVRQARPSPSALLYKYPRSVYSGLSRVSWPVCTRKYAIQTSLPALV